MRTWFPCFTACCQAQHDEVLKQAATPAPVCSITKETTITAPEASTHEDDKVVGVSQTVLELSQLGDVMRACSGIPGSSYYQLGRICGILAEHFRVSFVSASVLSSTGITYLPVVAGGRLARLCPVGLPQFLDASQATSFYQVAGQQRFLCRRVPGDALPPDWELLREVGGLAAFLAAAITVGSETVAVLTMADDDPSKFASPMWPTSMELVGAFMGHLFRDRQLVGYCGVVEELMAVDSLDELIRTLSRCVVRMQSEKLHQMRLTCRIACIASDASSAIIFDEALPYTSIPASGVEDSMGPPGLPGRQLAAAATGGFGRFSHTLSTQEGVLGGGHGGGGGGGGGGGSDPQLGPPGGHGRASSHTPRGRLGRLSMVSPTPIADPYLVALVTQYQVQMHSIANLVPDPPDAGPGPPLHHHHAAGQPGLLNHQHQHQAQHHQQHHQQQQQPAPLAPGLPSSNVNLVHSLLPSPGRLPSAAGVGPGPGPLGVGGPPALMPGGRIVGGGTSISQPGLYGGGSLTGEAVRDAGLWSALDPGVASNFSQQQLQVEGQTYLVENTLLAEAIANRAGVWIGDCVAFMQNPANPNADVFLAATAHHTTAMLLAVMWERSGYMSCGAAAPAAGGGGAVAAAAGSGTAGPGVSGRPSGLIAGVGPAALGLALGSGSHPQQPQPQLHPGQGPGAGPGPGPNLSLGPNLGGPCFRRPSARRVSVGPGTTLPSCNALPSNGTLPSGVAVASSGNASGLPSMPFSTTQATVLAAFGSTFPRPSPQSTIHGHAAAAAVAAAAAAVPTGGADGDLPSPKPLAPPGAHTGVLTSGEVPSGTLGGNPPSPGMLTTLGAGTSYTCNVMRSGDLPLLAFYLLTSGTASPSVLQELLVGLRELLVVLEPLVSSKLADELSDEWMQLQREVLDKTKILEQPKDRTIVLRNTAAQLGGVLNSHCSVDDGVSSIVSESLRPPSPGIQPPAGRYTTSGNVAAAPAPASSSAIHTGPAGTGAGGGGAAAGAAGGGGGGGVGSAVEVLRSVSDKTLAIGPGAGSPGAGMLVGSAGMGTGLGGLGGQQRPRNASFLMSRSFTGKRISALISGVQDRVQQAQRMSVSYNTLFSRPDDLRSINMLEKLGSGGFGTVYLGMYQSTEVAVKVILERDCEGSEVLRNAVELAVLSTLSHPNIVQVLTFFTDVTVQIPPVQARLSGTAPPIYLLPHEPSTVQLDLTPVPSLAADSNAPPLAAEGCSGGGGGGNSRCGGHSRTNSNSAGGGGGGGTMALGPIAAAAGAPQRPPAPPQPQGGQRQQLPLPGQAPKKALVILMEFCDAGCLADAIRNGVFREKVKGGYGAQQPAWSHIYLTLLEVALALRYLHSINLVHRDLKPQNVLLKSSPSDVRGFTAKLSDFGLVKLLTEADMMAAAATATANAARRQRRYSGTVSHVAPEAIHNGTANPVDVTVDIYAFGIVMWEILTGQPVYLGLTSDQIIDRVQNEGLRPTFPPDTPAEYAAMANRCWDVDPRRRPTAEELVQQMSSLSSLTRSSKVLAARRRLSTLSNKELLRNVANANLAAANLAAAAAAAHGLGGGGGGGGGGGRDGSAGGSGLLCGGPHRQAPPRHNEDDFPLHIL